MFNTTSYRALKMLIEVQSPCRLCAYDLESQNWICYYPITNRDGEVEDYFIEEFRYYTVASLYLEGKDLDECFEIQRLMAQCGCKEECAIIEFYKVKMNTRSASYCIDNIRKEWK